MKFANCLLFFTITCQLITKFTLGANEPYLSTQFCGGIFSDDEPLNSDYHNNVQNVLLYLQGQASPSNPPPPSFLKKSMGEVSTRAYGSYLCRGDLSAEKCQHCLVDAVSVISRDDQIMGYDCFLYNVNLECMLHYANTSNFMVYRKDNTITGEAFGDDLSNHQQYNSTLLHTMKELIREAGNGNWTNGANFTTREVEVLGSNENIYILVQCTPDISSMNCSTCLRDLRNSFPPKSVGGQALGANCLLKYNNQPLFSSAYRSFMRGYVHVILLMIYLTLM